MQIIFLLNRIVWFGLQIFILSTKPQHNENTN